MTGILILREATHFLLRDRPGLEEGARAGEQTRDHVPWGARLVVTCPSTASDTE